MKVGMGVLCEYSSRLKQGGASITPQFWDKGGQANAPDALFYMKSVQLKWEIANGIYFKLQEELESESIIRSRKDTA